MGVRFALLLSVLVSMGLGKPSVGHEEDIPMNLLKQVLLCSCQSLPRLELGVTAPRLEAQTREGQEDLGPGC